jgi:hypothetical protein
MEAPKLVFDRNTFIYLHDYIIKYNRYIMWEEILYVE